MQKWAEWVGYGGKIIPLGNLLISSASLRHCIATGLVTYSSCKAFNKMIDRSGKETEDSRHKQSASI